MRKTLLLKRALLTLFFALAATAVFAQKGTIQGTVLDAATGEPLIGTTIIIEGTTTGTTSGIDGGFTISNITPGGVAIIAQYLGYEVFRQNVTVVADRTEIVEVRLQSEGIGLEDVLVIAQIDNESENVLLSGQREALVAIQTVGAVEMSRKGIGDAQAAVSQVSGISQQEGVKNVFVRGLGDRYNATYLNGFPVPSEDPEYKNIALDFFGSDIIQNIGVNKVFNAATGGDVGGAVIDIRSKELIDRRAFSVSLDGGVNTAAVGADFLRAQDGVNYLGMGRNRQPAPGTFDFENKLDPHKVKLPLNHSYGVSGGRRWDLGENRNPLSFFVVANHSSDYSFTEETVRTYERDGLIYQDQKGEKSTIDTRQLVLANLDFDIDRRHEIAYNFMLIHANDQYVGDYSGTHPDYGEGYGEYGFTRRQQNNDDLLVVNQLSTVWTLSDRMDISVGAAYNMVRGREPDRRVNSLSRKADGSYILTGGTMQKRFFSELTENDINVKSALRWKIRRNADIDRSNISIGYNMRIVGDSFTAKNYILQPEKLSVNFPTLDDVSFDAIYNKTAFEQGLFSVPDFEDSTYEVSKSIHSGYIEATHEFSPRFSGIVGVQLDVVNLAVKYDVSQTQGSRDMKKFYPLPSLSLRYDITDRHTLRLGLSKSYTLPQSKEIAPYKYIGVNFKSEGNPDLVPSDNYNVDLKWDWYITSSELVSLGMFYKYIANPIGRVDQANAAGGLVYDNLSPKADVAGVELEVRKNILNTTTVRRNMRRLSVGFNASYIYSNLELDILNTPKRYTELEGASPVLVNGDLSYNYSSGDRVLNVSLVAGWFSDRIFTLGTVGYNDIIDEAATDFAAVASYKFDKHWTVKFKAGNLLNSPIVLSREFGSAGRIVLNEYRKGIDLSIGVTFEL